LKLLGAVLDERCAPIWRRLPRTCDVLHRLASALGPSSNIDAVDIASLAVLTEAQSCCLKEWIYAVNWQYSGVAVSHPKVDPK
jgi:hypothetical protein